MSEAEGAAPPRAEPRWGWLALALALLISFTGIWNHSLWTPDEPRVAGIGREMLASGDFLVPHLSGEPFLEKPPLTWWGMSAAMAIGGVTAGAARLSAGLCSFLVLLLVFDLGARLADRRAGLCALLVLASSWSFLSYGHRISVDVWLLLFVNLGYWCVARACLSEAGSEEPQVRAAPRMGWLIGAYAAGGLAFLSKGPIGPVLLFAPIAVLAASQRRWSLLRSWGHLVGLCALLAICSLWPALLYLRGGRPLLDAFLLDNVLFRVVDPSLVQEAERSLGHHHNVLYYLPRFFVILLPWTLLVPAAFLGLRRGELPERWNRAGLLVTACVLPIGLLLLSLPSTKRTVYLLPLLPSAAVGLGAWISAQKAAEARGWARFGVLSLTVLVSLIPLAPLLGSLALYSGLVKLDPWWDPVHQALSGWTLAAALLAALGVALGTLRWGLRLCRSGDSPPLFSYVLGGHFALALAYNLVVYPVLEPTKGLIRLSEGLREQGAFGPGLAALGLDETALGALAFYDEQHPEDLTPLDEAGLERWFVAHPGHTVLVRARAWDYLAEGTKRRLRPTYRWAFSDKGTYWLCQIRPQ